MRSNGNGSGADKISARGSDSGLRRGAVLVVDDEPLVAGSVRRVLSSECDVMTLTSARAALALLATGKRFDVILCDLMMPEMSGVDLFRALVKETPEQAERVVFLTGGASSPAVQEFLEGVPNVRVDKPFDIGGLRALIRDRLGTQ